VTLDTSSLPRVAGAEATFASPSTTIFMTKTQVPKAAEEASAALAGEGWQRYGAPFAAEADIPNMKIMNFKKDAQAISVYVTMAPAYGNATSLQYTAITVENDLPFPKDASDISFDPTRPYMSCTTADLVAPALDFFTRELGAAGWKQWSPPPGAKGSNSVTDKGASLFFIRENQKPLLLTLQRHEDVRTSAKIEAVSPELLAELSKPKAEEKAVAAPVVPQPSEANPAGDQKSAFDDLAKDILKQVGEAARDITADALAGKKPASSAPAEAAGAPLLARVGNEYPIPLPETAENPEYDSADGEIEFRSPSSTAALAAFYRAAMTPLGWKEKKSLIKLDNITVLRFEKGEQDLSFTIMKMGETSRVSAEGEILITTKPAAESDNENNSANEPASAEPEPQLEVELNNGLPVPKQHTSAGYESSMFRVTAFASVPARIETVLAFYRRELTTLGWTEETAGAMIKADEAKVGFTAPEGPALLTLTRNNSETAVSLFLRKKAEAVKSGLLPKPGQGKLLFGNVMETEASLTINNQTIKGKAGIGGKKPDGPTLELPPGKYKFSFKVAGQPAQSDELEVKADEMWGLLLGPGGALPLQMY